ncbi:MAG: D-alanine--D-alanine ligase [Gammaproteobacteria bacterium]|nr:MAG: D-alanine--D-alanine ligase [Gammaproteobacteria bacterium]
MNIKGDQAIQRDPEEYGKVAVLMGGWAAEREVSLNSGNAVLEALKAAGVDAHAVVIDRENVVSEIENGGFDRAFNILHGRGGEDGVIQGFLETLGISYTGSGIMASSVAMDKLRTKQMWMGAGLRSPAIYVSMNDDVDYAAIDNLGYPVMVKPIHEGSSIGMSKVDDISDFDDAWNLAREYDTTVMVEKWIRGTEYTAAIVNGESLPLIRLETPEEFYDYDAKYKLNTTEYYCPSGLPAEREEELKALTRIAFGAVGAKGWGRVDFILDEDDVPWLIEVNTVPGMTDHSLVPMAAKAAGISFEELVLMILEGSMEQDS